MTTQPKCTCSEIQIALVGCDCAADHWLDEQPKRHPDFAARQAHSEEVCAAARRDAEANVDNAAAYAASSADYYAYTAEWKWRSEMIELETAAAEA